MPALSSAAHGELSYQTLVQSMPAALAAADSQGRQTFVNSAFCQLVGWSEEELLGQQIPFVYWSAEDVPAFLNGFKEIHSHLDSLSETVAVMRFCRRDGERLLVRLKLAPLADSTGRAIGTIMAVEDLRQIDEMKETLRERDHFIDSVTQALTEIIYVFDLPKKEIFYSNRNFGEPLGYSSEKIRAMGANIVEELMHPDDAARLPEWFGRWATTKDDEVLETEYRLLSAQGEFRWFLSREIVFRRDGAGSVIQFIGAAQDITARKEAEAAHFENERHLRESERRYRLLADNATDMICRLAPSGLYRDTSPACARLIGYTPHELLGRSEYELIHPEDRDRVFQFHRRIIAEKCNLTISYRIHRKANGYVWFEIHAQPILDPTTLDVVEILSVSRDITDRMNAEEAIRQSEERFRTLVERSSDGIAMVDEQGRIRYLSPAAGRILGYGQADLAGMDARTLVLPEDVESISFRAREVLAVPGGTFSTRVRVRNRKGAVRHLEGIITNHFTDPYIRGFVVNFIDVTERMELEEQLRQAQKMEAIGQLAGGIAHDFNNILTAIIGNVSILLDATSPLDANHSTLSAIEKAAKRAGELTNRLLGYSRRTTLYLQAVDANRIVVETLALLRPTIDPRIVFDLHLDPEVWPARVDADQISQILTNLCLNSRDAMPHGGRLRIASTSAVIGDDYVKTQVIAQAGEYVRLTVEDTGTGMTPEVRARVFEPFFTTKSIGAGTGLGLAMVYGILKAHGGWVTCDSEVGAGTRMELFLPRSIQPVEASPLVESPGPVPNSANGEMVLLVDDEPAIRALGRFVLEQNGYRVLLG